MGVSIFKGPVVVAVMVLLVGCGGTSGSQPQQSPAPRVATSPGTAAASASAQSQATSEADHGDGGGLIQVEGQQMSDHGTQRVASAAEDDGSVDLELDSEGDEYYFSPTILVGDAGERVTLRLENEASVPHNFTFGSSDVDVQPGQTRTVDVRFPKKGTEVFFCKFHVDLGMAGALRVG